MKKRWVMWLAASLARSLRSPSVVGRLGARVGRARG